jgi:hypothetical protein
VIFGQASGWLAKFNLATLNGNNGFVIEGLSAGNYLGRPSVSVSTAGDLNGDGKADLVVGAPYAVLGGRVQAGATYVIFGKNATVIPRTNRPPIVTHPIPDQHIEVETPFNFTIASDTFTDPDGDSLTYSAQQTDGSPLPSGLSFDANSRFFFGTVPLAGNTSLSVQAADTGSLSTRANFSLLSTPMTSAPSNSLGAIVGGIVGGVAAAGVAGAAYLAYKMGFFASLGRGENNDQENLTAEAPTVSL